MLMQKRTLLLASLLLAAGALTPVLSQAGVAIDINVAPPAPVVETVPAPPQPGYVWAAGYWNWEGGRHVWVPGHYMEPRPGYRWEPDRWDHRGDRYHYEPGHWAR
jgi:hypothetical protein